MDRGVSIKAFFEFSETGNDFQTRPEQNMDVSAYYISNADPVLVQWQTQHRLFYHTVGKGEVSGGGGWNWTTLSKIPKLSHQLYVEETMYVESNLP